MIAHCMLGINSESGAVVQRKTWNHVPTHERQRQKRRNKEANGRPEWLGLILAGAMRLVPSP
jgi:hypothetical protein